MSRHLLSRLKRRLRWLLRGDSLRLRRDGRPARTQLLPYPQWLEHHVAERGAAYPVPDRPATFSVLTTVYEKTEPRFLRETAYSLARQSLPFHEWIILAHGPVSTELSALLDELAADRRIKVHRCPSNLGIVGGMRFCLEAAEGEYVVAVDADDILTPDALQILASVIGPEREHAFLFSDEDILLDGAPASPYWRPDWDPVLNLESSYIWHLCSFRRDHALELGVYSDPGCNWCHDWDTITRFADAGHAPTHVREVLYHWRRHSLSSTHRAKPHQGSLESTRHFLEQRIARTGRADLYHIAQFPIFRGTPEWHISRYHRDPLPADLILVVSKPDRALLTLGSMERRLDYPLQSVTLCLPAEAPQDARSILEQYGRALCGKEAGKSVVRWIEGNGCTALASATRAAAGPLLWLCSDAIELTDGEAPWEALRLMELHPDVKMVCGKLVDRGDRIVSAGSVLSRSGHPVHPYLGLPALEAGPFALALKPQTVDVPTPDLLIADRDFIVDAFAQIPAWASPAGLAMWLAGAALAVKARTAFSPLIYAVAKAPLFTARSSSSIPERERDFFLTRYGQCIGNRKLSFSRHIDLQEQYTD